MSGNSATDSGGKEFPPYENSGAAESGSPEKQTDSRERNEGAVAESSGAEEKVKSGAGGGDLGPDSGADQSLQKGVKGQDEQQSQEGERKGLSSPVEQKSDDEDLHRGNPQVEAEGKERGARDNRGGRGKGRALGEGEKQGGGGERRGRRVGEGERQGGGGGAGGKKRKVGGESGGMEKTEEKRGQGKQQQQRGGFSIRKYFSTDPQRPIRDRKYYESLSLKEKRKHYKCRNYVTLKEIETWTSIRQCYSDGIEKKPIRSPSPSLDEKVSLWRGDITQLEIDAIVNAANSSLLGGGGVDGAIHRAAGNSLYEECVELNGCNAGNTKITSGHALPAKYILHTVGPMNGRREVLESCYNSCLSLALKHNIKSLAFCCIATGIYGYPNEEAAEVALSLTRCWLEEHADKVDRIIFCVFLEKDVGIYLHKLYSYFPPEDAGRGEKALGIAKGNEEVKAEQEMKVERKGNKKKAKKTEATAKKAEANKGKATENKGMETENKGMEKQQQTEGKSAEDSPSNVEPDNKPGSDASSEAGQRRPPPPVVRSISEPAKRNNTEPKAAESEAMETEDTGDKNGKSTKNSPGKSSGESPPKSRGTEPDNQGSDAPSETVKPPLVTESEQDSADAPKIESDQTADGTKDTADGNTIDSKADKRMKSTSVEHTNTGHAGDAGST